MSNRLYRAFQRSLAASLGVFVSVLILGLGASQASAQACPSFQQSGSAASVDANSLWSPRDFSVTAGGNIDLGLCGSVPGHGFIVQSPDFTIGYNNLNMGRDLEIRVNGSCDTVLLVNDANGQWHFSDDENGTFNPSMRLPNAPSGSYDIWVGTFSQGNCGATMSMETFGGGAVPPPPPPPPPPVMGNFPPPFARTVFPDPGNLTAWRGRTGQIVSFAVTPANNGTVWGTDIYTDDSSLAMAAVHAGLLLPGQTGIVTVVIRPGQNSYPGTARNGVQTQNFANWGGSFSFVFP